MQIVFIYGTRISSRLTKLFTGSTCYHVGFTDGIKFWDMNLIRRRRLWTGHARWANSYNLLTTLGATTL